MRLTRTATEESTVRFSLPHVETVSTVLIVWIHRQRVRPTYDAEVDDYVFLGPTVSTTNDSLDDEKNGTAFLSNSGLLAPARQSTLWQTARLGLLG